MLWSYASLSQKKRRPLLIKVGLCQTGQCCVLAHYGCSWCARLCCQKPASRRRYLGTDAFYAFSWPAPYSCAEDELQTSAQQQPWSDLYFSKQTVRWIAKCIFTHAASCSSLSCVTSKALICPEAPSHADFVQSSLSRSLMLLLVHASSLRMLIPLVSWKKPWAPSVKVNDFRLACLLCGRA